MKKEDLSIMNYSSMLTMTKYFVFFHLVFFIIASKQPQTLEALCSEIVAQQKLSANLQMLKLYLCAP